MNAKAVKPGWHPATLNSQIAVARLGADHFRALIIGDDVLVGAAFGRTEEEARSNAKRIAAVADLIDALKDTTRMLEAVRLSAGLGKGQIERLEKAKAVVAKATGAKP